MAQKLKFGNGTWATKKGSTLSYNDEGGNYKPLPFTTTRNSIATRVNKEGLIEVVGNDLPRIDYTDSADGVLLLEKAATNLFEYSESFSNSYWTKNNITESIGYLAPDGTSNAYRLIASATDSSMYKTFSVTSGTTYSLSFYLKTVSGTLETTIGLGSPGFPQNEGDGGRYKSITVTNEWKRYTLTSTADATAISGISFGGFGGFSTGEEVLIYGAQLEVGSYPTSYIPTQGSTVTRQADTASGAGNSAVFSDSQGVLFADISSQNDSSTKLISLASTSGSENTVWIGYANGVYGIIRSNGVTTVETNIVPTQSNEITKCAILYSNSNVKFYVNGFNLFEDTNISMPIGLDQLRFSRKGGSLPFYGKTKEVGYYDEILTDLELETLTSYRSLNELVTELNLNTL